MPKVENEEELKTNSTPLVTGNLWLAIWTMSWPLLLTTIANSFIGLVDVYVARTLGSDTQAAVGLAEHVLFLFLLFILSVGVGTTAIVSRAFGAGDREDMIRATGQSFALSIVLGLLMAATATLLGQYVLPHFSPSEAVRQIGRTYLIAYSFMLIPFSITVIANAAFRAIGDSKTPLYIVSVVTAINIAGDFLTVIYGWPVAGLKSLGMAYSALVGSSVGAVLAILFIRRSPLKDSLKAIYPFNFKEIMRVARIGIPSALHRLTWSLSVFVVFFILKVCPDSISAMASWTIGMRVESLIFMPLMALSLAVASIVGQNLGAGQRDRAFEAGWRVTWIGVWTMVALGVVLYLAALPIAKTMSNDPGTIAYTADYLRINAVAEPFLALGMVLAGALQGAGDTKTPMYITLVCNWLIRIPIAYALALVLHIGPNGVWSAMVISVIIQGLLTSWRYQSKTWLETKL
jgi:MATE family multidrug resistance protein